MRIALVGYGKMGKAIEAVIAQQQHSISYIITSENKSDIDLINLENTDVVIEFTNPSVAAENVIACLKKGVPVVCGSTGWHEKMDEAKSTCLKFNTSLIISSNFSIGVNLFFELNAHLAQLMKGYAEYDVQMKEIHHIHKKDAPSGTAVTIAEGIMQHMSHKVRWSLTDRDANDSIYVEVERKGEVPGTHSVLYSSSIDDIYIEHKANNRDGFAQGAVVAATYIVGKKGIFEMKDVLGLKY
jgi:4-hydroxy-tetrahydrodipicolinate reductase